MFTVFITMVDKFFIIVCLTFLHLVHQTHTICPYNSVKVSDDDDHNTFVCKSGTEPPKVFSDSTISTRSFLSTRTLLWPDGVVPYTIDSRFTPYQTWLILKAMRMFSRVSCVRWVPWTLERDRVDFVWTKEKGVCSSEVGRMGGNQDLKFGNNCFHFDRGYPGAIEHEMMHALGFIHEHQRLDRNCYVRVNSSAISDSPVDYAIIPDTDTNFPYDFNSIMHYGTPSIQCISDHKIGNAKGNLTDLDVMKLNHLYCGGPSFCEISPVDCYRFKKLHYFCTQADKTPACME